MLSCVLPVTRYTVPRRSKASPYLFHQKETALVQFCDDEVYARTNPHPNPSDRSRRPPVPLTIDTNAAAAAAAAAADLQRRYSSSRRLGLIRFSLRRRPSSLPTCRCRRRRFRRGRYGGIRRRRTGSAGRRAGPAHHQHVIYRGWVVARGCVLAGLDESRNNKRRRTPETSTHCCCTGLSSCACYSGSNCKTNILV